VEGAEANDGTNGNGQDGDGIDTTPVPLDRDSVQNEGTDNDTSTPQEEGSGVGEGQAQEANVPAQPDGDITLPTPDADAPTTGETTPDAQDALTTPDSDVTSTTPDANGTQGNTPEISVPSDLVRPDGNWSLEDKIQRWNDYQAGNADNSQWNYDRWSNNYDARARTAQEAGQAARDYADTRRQHEDAAEGQRVVDADNEKVVQLIEPRPNTDDPVELQRWQDRADAVRERVEAEFRRMEADTRRDPDYTPTDLSTLSDPTRRRVDTALTIERTGTNTDADTPSTGDASGTTNTGAPESFRRGQTSDGTSTETTLIEYKSGDAYRTDAHLMEAARDIELARSGNRVEWVVRGHMPDAFRTHLENNGVIVTMLRDE
jgi:hypothetical protein